MPAVTYIQEAERNDTVVFISPQIEALTGYSPEEFAADPELWLKMLHPDDRERVLAEDERTDGLGEPYEAEYRMVARDGRVVWVRDEAVIVRDARGRPLHWRGIMLDITESKTLQNELVHQAFHDALTGLPNRQLFADRLAHALERTRRRDPPNGAVAVLFVDLDNFKFVNDSLGHDAGDELLVAVAERLSGRVRLGDTIARLGGDEFVLLLEDITSVKEATEVAERTAAAFAAPFAVKGQDIFVTTSIGIALGGAGGGGSEDLLRDADLAMYGAKRNGKAGYEVFDASMNPSRRTS